MTKTIIEIAVVEVEKRRVPSKHYVYVVVVKWSDNCSMVVYRRYSRFFDLQTQLLDKFPIEAGTTDPSLRIIPFLPGKIFFGRSHVRDVAMKRLGEINTYCKNLLAMPPHISQCEEVLEFFEVEPEDLDPPKEDQNERRFSRSLLGGKHKGEKKAEKISGPKRLEQFTAVADYEAQEKGEMTLQVGMVVEVTEKSESGWWFVNAEEQQGWVPSTYLEPVNGATASQAPCAKEGQEEKYICIETFTADNADEVSLEKGVIVEVLQKNMDGWWTVRYQEQEGFAPATYLKKSSDPYAKNLVEKSRQSGVKIIGNLADISNLMAGSSSPRNSGIFSTNSPRNSAYLDSAPAEAATDASIPVAQKSGKEGSEDEWEEEENVVHEMGPKGDSYATVIMKQRSLERGGSLRPPPRQNSVKSMVVNPPPPPSPARSSAYITIADFEDTVGDGISFSVGELVTVLEKTSSGWWFVKRGQEEGWVPESYLEQSGTQTSMAIDEKADEELSDEDQEESDEDEKAQPPSALANALNSRFKGLSDAKKTSAPATSGVPKLPGKSMSKPPPLPSKPQEEKDVQDESRDGKGVFPLAKEPPAGLASALKSRFESKPPSLPNKPAEKPGPPGLPSKPVSKPGPPWLPSKPAEKPGLPALPSKPPEKPGPPGLPVKPANKPGPPELPGKPTDKPGPPKKPGRSEESSALGGVTGLTSALKSRFENPQQDDKPNKPVKPSFQHSKPALPSKSFGASGDQQGNSMFPRNRDSNVKPSAMQKPTLPHKNDNTSTGAVKPQFPPSKPSSGPPKLPSKPQASSKPNSDSNNNTSSVNRPTSKVQSMASAFGKMGVSQTPSSRESGSKPTLPVKKPTPPQIPNQKPTNRVSDTASSKPRVGNLVSELGSKLQFGGSGIGNGGNAHRDPEVSPVSKTSPWTTQQRDSGKSSEPSQAAKVPPWSTQQKDSGVRASVPKLPTPAKSGGKEYEVVADFSAASEGEVSLECGDMVEVLDQNQQDWWLVRLNGEEGWAPSSYLEPAAEWDD